MERKFLMIIIVSCWMITSINGQRVLPLPEKFIRPIRYVDAGDQYRMVNERGRPNKENVPWMVIMDRDVWTFDSYKSKREKKKELKFKEIAYVTEENEEWIRLGRSSLRIDKNKMRFRDDGEDLGWIMKEQVLLWRSSMIDETSRIHAKGFLLNKATDIKKLLKEKNKKIARVYDGPSSRKDIDKKSIYDFFFIYKVEGNRSLLGKEYKLTSSSIKDDLIGWVDNSRISQWNTRVALEPNFDEEAFNERQQDPNKRIVAFASAVQADAYAKTGKASDILWDNDPVKINPSKLAETNPRRHKGPQIRFPMLDRTRNFYVSGSINKLPTKNINEKFVGKDGEMDETNFAKMQDIVQYCQKRRDNINVFFLIEATQDQNKYKQYILDAIEDIEFSLPEDIGVKYGAGLYRDSELSEMGKDFELLSLNRSKRTFVNFINKAVFDDYGDVDGWTNLYYGMSQAVKKGDFSKNQANLMFVIGNHADFRADPSRKLAAKSGNNSKYLVNTKKLRNKLSEFNMNMVFIQTHEDKSSISSALFPKKVRGVIKSTANHLYKDYQGIITEFPDLKLKVPFMLDIDDSQASEIELENGINICRLYRANHSSLSQSKLQDIVEESIIDVTKLYENYYNDFSNVINNGEGINFDDTGGYWSAGFAAIMNKYLRDAGQDEKAKEDYKQIINEKLKLYHRVYIPNSVLGAMHPPLSFVVFMPEDDLLDYIRELERLNNAVNDSPDRLRENLFDVFAHMVQKFAGEMSKSAVKQTKVDDLRSLMQGIKDEGYFIGEQFDFDLGDILNRKKMSDEQLDKIAAMILIKYRKLKKIKKEGKNYEFSYTVNKNTYYWIPAKYLF